MSIGLHNHQGHHTETHRLDLGTASLWFSNQECIAVQYDTTQVRRSSTPARRVDEIGIRGFSQVTKQELQAHVLHALRRYVFYSTTSEQLNDELNRRAGKILQTG